MSEFKDKNVLITGGTSGIGRATALAFAQAGAKVVITGRREKESVEVVSESKKASGEVTFFKGDKGRGSSGRGRNSFDGVWAAKHCVQQRWDRVTRAAGSST